MKWVISVGGYGSFLFEGTEQQAEEMRRHKANWERGVGRKRLATIAETENGVIDDCNNHPNYQTNSRFYCKCPRCANNVVEAHEK